MTRDDFSDGSDSLGERLDKLKRCLTIMIWYLGFHVAFAAGMTVYLLIFLFRDGVF